MVYAEGWFRIYRFEASFASVRHPVIDETSGLLKSTKAYPSTGLRNMVVEGRWAKLLAAERRCPRISFAILWVRNKVLRFEVH